MMKTQFKNKSKTDTLELFLQQRSQGLSGGVTPTFSTMSINSPQNIWPQRFNNLGLIQPNHKGVFYIIGRIDKSVITSWNDGDDSLNFVLKDPNNVSILNLKNQYNFFLEAGGNINLLDNNTTFEFIKDDAGNVEFVAQLSAELNTTKHIIKFLDDGSFSPSGIYTVYDNALNNSFIVNDDDVTLGIKKIDLAIVSQYDADEHYRVIYDSHHYDNKSNKILISYNMINNKLNSLNILPIYDVKDGNIVKIHSTEFSASTPSLVQEKIKISTNNFHGNNARKPVSIALYNSELKLEKSNCNYAQLLRLKYKNTGDVHPFLRGQTEVVSQADYELNLSQGWYGNASSLPGNVPSKLHSVENVDDVTLDFQKTPGSDKLNETFDSIEVPTSELKGDSVDYYAMLMPQSKLSIDLVLELDANLNPSPIEIFSGFPLRNPAGEPYYKKKLLLSAKKENVTVFSNNTMNAACSTNWKECWVENVGVALDDEGKVEVEDYPIANQGDINRIENGKPYYESSAFLAFLSLENNPVVENPPHTENIITFDFERNDYLSNGNKVSTSELINKTVVKIPLGTNLNNSHAFPDNYATDSFPSVSQGFVYRFNITDDEDSRNPKLIPEDRVIAKFGPYVVLNAKKFESYYDLFGDDILSPFRHYQRLSDKNLPGDADVQESVTHAQVSSENIYGETSLAHLPESDELYDLFQINSMFQKCENYISSKGINSGKQIKLFFVSDNKYSVVTKDNNGQLNFDSVNSDKLHSDDPNQLSEKDIDFELYDGSEAFFLMRMKTSSNQIMYGNPTLPLKYMHSTFTGKQWKFSANEPSVRILITYKRPLADGSMSGWKFWDVSLDNIYELYGTSAFQAQGWIFKVSVVTQQQATAASAGLVSRLGLSNTELVLDSMINTYITQGIEPVEPQLYFSPTDEQTTEYGNDNVIYKYNNTVYNVETSEINTDLSIEIFDDTAEAYINLKTVNNCQLGYRGVCDVYALRMFSTGTDNVLDVDFYDSNQNRDDAMKSLSYDLTHGQGQVQTIMLENWPQNQYKHTVSIPSIKENELYKLNFVAQNGESNRLSMSYKLKTNVDVTLAGNSLYTVPDEITPVPKQDLYKVTPSDGGWGETKSVGLNVGQVSYFKFTDKDKALMVDQYNSTNSNEQVPVYTYIPESSSTFVSVTESNFQLKIESMNHGVVTLFGTNNIVVLESTKDGVDDTDVLTRPRKSQPSTTKLSFSVNGNNMTIQDEEGVSTIVSSDTVLKIQVAGVGKYGNGNYKKLNRLSLREDLKKEFDVKIIKITNGEEEKQVSHHKVLLNNETDVAKLLTLQHNAPLHKDITGALGKDGVIDTDDLDALLMNYGAVVQTD